MKKSTKMSKRIVAIFMVMIFSINTFGAIVSDNDGSAFITKAEFDSLKSNFQAQIDNYNTSIDSKIDGAIAAYLAGIKIEQRQTSSPIFKDWEKVNFLGDTVAPTFAYPTISNTLGLSMYSWAMDEGNSKYNLKMIAFEWRGNYDKTWSSSEYALRPLVSVSGSEADHKDYIWNGIANRYQEKVATNTLGRYDYNDFAYLNMGTNYVRFYFKNPFLFKANGYNAGLWSDNQFWKGSFKFQFRNSPSSSTWLEATQNGLTTRATTVLQVELGKVNEKEKQYEHVIQYDGSKKWHVSNETFVNTYAICEKNDKTIKNLNDVSTKTNFSMFLAAIADISSNNATRSYGTMPFTYDAEDTSKIPSVGYIGEIESNKIYQYKDKVDIAFKKQNLELDKVHLNNGWPLHPIQKGVTLDWECEFSKVETTTSSGTKEVNKKEVDIYFSYEPFTDKLETSDAVKVTNTSDGKIYDYITTKDRKAKLKITGDKDKIIYVKCIPHFDSGEKDLLEKYWDVELDVKKSLNIGYVEAE